MSRFDIVDLPLAGVKRVTRQRLGDARGFFSRVFCAEELAVAGWAESVAQINQTLTRHRGTVRGLHFQRPPDAEMKLVSCLKGEVWDVVVDLRPGSPTYLQWHAEILSEQNCCAMLVPKGCAHGFQTLVDEVEMLYLHSAAYAQQSEDGLLVTDHRLDIPWPLPITEISARDQSLPALTDTFKGVDLS